MNFSIKPPESQHEQTQLQEEEAAAELQINKCFWQWRRKNTPTPRLTLFVTFTPNDK